MSAIPSAAEFIRRVDEASGTKWVGDTLVRFAPELTDAEADALNELADQLAQEQEDRDELARDKQDSERQRYGYGSGE